MQPQTYYPYALPQMQQPSMWQGPYYNIPQPQQPVSQNQIRGLSGRQIASPSEITPNEVSMDGSVSLFPMSNYSAIYAKAWNSDGTIKTVKFIPDTGSNETVIDPFAPIIERLDKIEKMLSKNNYKRQYIPKEQPKGEPK